MELNSYTLGYEEDDLSAVDLHSMSSLIIRMFADVGSDDNETALCQQNGRPPHPYTSGLFSMTTPSRSLIGMDRGFW